MPVFLLVVVHRADAAQVGEPDRRDEDRGRDRSVHQCDSAVEVAVASRWAARNWSTSARRLAIAVTSDTPAALTLLVLLPIVWEVVRG